MREGIAIRPLVSTLSQTISSLTTGIAKDIYPTPAQSNVPRGVVGHGAITAGSGGANGTFPLAFSGGNFDVDPTGTFTVAGGAVTAINFVTPGEYIGASPTAPTLSFAASSGLTGASATATVGFLIPSNGRYWTLSADGAALVQYRNVAGVATAVTPAVTMATSDGIDTALADAAVFATAEAERAEAAATTVESVRRSVLLNGDLPVGWIFPNDFTGVSWTSGFSHLRYSDGMQVWAMLPDDATTLVGWRITGGPRVRHPDDGKYYVAVNMASVYNPTAQGVAVTERYVDVNAGNNANTGAIGSQWKTVDHAIAQVNALGAGTYRIWVKSTDFIPSNSEGWNATTYTIGTGVKLSIVVLPKADGKQPIYVPGMRRSGYLAVNWAFSDIGDGWFKCITGSISAAAKNTPCVFDPSVRDADGHPTPCVALTGTLADDAAVKAAANGQPAFYRRVADNHFYVKLPSGTTPIPGANFVYVESQTQLTINLNEGARFHLKGVDMINNMSISSLAGIQLRPTTISLGPTQPVVEHDIQAAIEECSFTGLSGNGILAFDIARCVVWNCKGAYNWLDGVNQSTFYTPGNSNGTAMGSAQHMLVYGHIDFQHGPNGAKDQPAVNTSANGPTTHSRCNMEDMNGRYYGSNGSCAAVVGGAKFLAVNSAMHGPKLVTPGADVYTACWLASGNSAYTTSIPSEIVGLYCVGSTRPNGRDFYVGPTAKMNQAHYRNRTYTKQVDSGGILQDGFGSNL